MVKRYEDEFKIKMVELFNAGKPIREIIAENGMSSSSLNKWINSYNTNKSFKIKENRNEKCIKPIALQKELKQVKIQNDRVIKQGGTFALNKFEPIHNWYYYVEAYSSCLIEYQINELKKENIKTIYDPFGGSGTTPLVASQNGLISFYSESNPFMCKVINAKINCVKIIHDNPYKKELLLDFKKQLQQEQEQLQFFYDDISWGGFEKFFAKDKLNDVLKIKSLIESIGDQDVKDVLMITLSSILVSVSNMVRRGDLRYATEKELEKKDSIVYDVFLEKLDIVLFDIINHASSVKCCTQKLSEDVREINLDNKVDCVITSPPYLNGTNYIRNTKLELKLNDFLCTEKDLPEFHSKGIIAGINNVSKRNGKIEVLEEVKPYIDKLLPVAYDARIVNMVTGYFSDMKIVISKLQRILKNDGIFIMDIGDSQFAGIHIPTHEILSQICNNYGFVKYDETVLRERRSKNGMVLSQRLLKFRLNKDISKEDEFRADAINFIKELPYKTSPYNGRNWGHSWHSLCSYHGKLKPAIAHFLINNFTKEGDVVLDPFSGVGTIPFEACLQGRIGVGNDLSKLAYVVTKSKLEKPEYEEVIKEIELLETYIKQQKVNVGISRNINKYGSFGYNKELIDYFEIETFKEILCARQYFKKTLELSSAQCLVFSSLLHVLHGNRPYAISRTSHPLTPYAPKGDFIYKNVIEHIRAKIELSYKKLEFDKYIKGEAIFGDYEYINKFASVDVIISSPPFADSIKFYMQNWMRLWLCGWEEDDFKNADKVFLDVKQKKDFSIYTLFFKMCYENLKENGKVILHLGKTDKFDMAEILSKYSQPYFKEIYRGSESVSNIEKHGIKDKGNTIEHQFLFLMKK